MTPGEVLVPFPELEERQAANLLRGLYPCHRVSDRPAARIAYPALSYEADVCPVRERMAEDRQRAAKIKQEDVWGQYKYKRKIKEAYMPERKSRRTYGF